MYAHNVREYVWIMNISIPECLSIELYLMCSYYLYPTPSTRMSAHQYLPPSEPPSENCLSIKSSSYCWWVGWWSTSSSQYSWWDMREGNGQVVSCRLVKMNYSKLTQTQCCIRAQLSTSRSITYQMVDEGQKQWCPEFYVNYN